MPITFKAEKSHIQNSDGTYTVYIRLLKDRKKKMVNTGIRIGDKVWNANPRDKGTGLKEYVSKKHILSDEYNQRIFSLIQKGERAITTASEKGEDLQVDQLQAIMSGKDQEQTKSFIQWALRQIDIEYPPSRKESLNRKYKQSVNLLKASRGKPDIFFYEVNLNLIKHFSNFLIEKGYDPSYVKKKLENIKTLIDIAIVHNVYHETNPFAYFKKPVAPKKQKPVLSLAEIGQLDQLTKLTEPQQQARDIFFWQLYLAGARIGDCLFCRIEDVRLAIDESGNAIYRWEYTTRKSMQDGHPKRLSVILTQKAIHIYNRYKADRQSGFLFPYLPSDTKNIHTPATEKLVNRKNSLINKYLTQLSERIERTDRLTTHVARYTFRNLAKGDIEAIRDLLGHSSVSTTEIYGNQKEQNKLDEILKNTWQ